MMTDYCWAADDEDDGDGTNWEGRRSDVPSLCSKTMRRRSDSFSCDEGELFIIFLVFVFIWYQLLIKIQKYKRKDVIPVNP